MQQNWINTIRLNYSNDICSVPAYAQPNQLSKHATTQTLLWHGTELANAISLHEFYCSLLLGNQAYVSPCFISIKQPEKNIYKHLEWKSAGKFTFMNHNAFLKVCKYSHYEC